MSVLLYLLTPVLAQVSLPAHVEEARSQLSYSWDSLEWDEAHQRNSAETYCYCGERGDWYKKMLQCKDCLQWFHQECIRALSHPLLCGDRSVGRDIIVLRVCW